MLRGSVLVFWVRKRIFSLCSPLWGRRVLPGCRQFACRGIQACALTVPTVYPLACSSQGLQRFCIEYKVRLARVDKVLLTRVCSETAAGLPGAVPTLLGCCIRTLVAVSTTLCCCIRTLVAVSTTLCCCIRTLVAVSAPWLLYPHLGCCIPNFMLLYPHLGCCIHNFMLL